jgi:uncharacterized protein (TIRG00374 family)
MRIVNPATYLSFFCKLCRINADMSLKKEDRDKRLHLTILSIRDTSCDLLDKTEEGITRRSGTGSLDMADAKRYNMQMRSARKIIVMALLLSVVVYICFSIFAAYSSGAASFRKDIASISWIDYLAALVCVFLADVIAFPKWGLYCRRLGIKIGIAKNFAIYMSLNSMNIVPGRWGRAIASYLLKKTNGIRFASTLPAVVVDIFTDFAGFGIVAIAAALFVRGYLLISMVLVAILLLPFVFLFSRRAYRLVRRKLERFKILRKVLEGEDAYFRASRTFGLDVYLYSLLVTIPSTLLSALALYFVILTFGVHIGLGYLPTIVFIYCTVTLLGMVSGIPGSLGVADVSMLGLLLLFLQPFGIDLGIASLVTIFARIATLWWGELYGFGFLAYVVRYLE